MSLASQDSGHTAPWRGQPWVLPVKPHIVTTTAVRSTLLVASRAQLRVAGLFDAYERHLPSASKATLDSVIAASWVPVELAHAHYTALDALDLSEADILACTRPSGEKLHHMFLMTALRFARTAGLTPWTGLPICYRIWERLFDGGGGGVQQLGPKEALVVVVGHPLLRYRYHRIGLRSHVELVLSLCCRKGYLRESACDLDQGTLSLLARWV